MKTIDQKAARRAFVNASKSRAASATFPAAWPDDLDERDLVGWVDPKAPLRAYVLTDVGDDLTMLELRLPGSSGSRRKSMCDLCHAMDAPEGSLLVVAPRSGARGRSGDTVGLYVCADFGCSARAREPLPEHRRPADGVPDTRVEELRERIGAFVARVTGS
ncbi:MAG: FBP domain-containing protein [Actinomycetales bacterium]|nr:MAG: FBP domain-containing protein [Actinomycetales bacterium]